MIADAAGIITALTGLVAAIASLTAVVLGFLNRRRLSSKITNGDVTWTGRPKKKTVGDVIDDLRKLEQVNATVLEQIHDLAADNRKMAEMLIDRTDRFNRIDLALDNLGIRLSDVAEKDREWIMRLIDQQNQRRE